MFCMIFFHVVRVPTHLVHIRGVYIYNQWDVVSDPFFVPLYCRVLVSLATSFTHSPTHPPTLCLCLSPLSVFPAAANPFLKYNSEDSCRYRYQFDNRKDLVASWTAAQGRGFEGQVLVAQVSADEDDGSAKLLISVFLVAAIR